MQGSIPADQYPSYAEANSFQGQQLPQQDVLETVAADQYPSCAEANSFRSQQLPQQDVLYQ